MLLRLSLGFCSCEHSHTVCEHCNELNSLSAPCSAFTHCIPHRHNYTNPIQFNPIDVCVCMCRSLISYIAHAYTVIRNPKIHMGLSDILYFNCVVAPQYHLRTHSLSIAMFALASIHSSKREKKKQQLEHTILFFSYLLTMICSRLARYVGDSLECCCVQFSTHGSNVFAYSFLLHFSFATLSNVVVI